MKSNSLFRFSVVLLAMLTSLAMARAPLSIAPDFSLPVYGRDSQTVALSDYNGKKNVLLVFWATWCPSCRQEIPRVNDLFEKFASSERLEILGINHKEKSEEISDFISENGIKYTVLLDANGHVADQYRLDGIPVIILISKTGKILYYGFSVPHNIDELINQGEVQ